MNALRSEPTSLTKDSIGKEEHNIEISETPKLFKILENNADCWNMN